MEVRLLDKLAAHSQHVTSFDGDLQWDWANYNGVWLIYNGYLGGNEGIMSILSLK